MDRPLEKNGTGCYDLVIVGGLGRVGLPLGITFAHQGLRVCLYDIDFAKAESVKKGVMPFIEYGAEPILKEVVSQNRLDISSDISVVSRAPYIIITIGTSVDEYLNPKVGTFFQLFNDLRPYLRADQTVIIRSTIFPYICQRVAELLEAGSTPWNIAYCPERISQGYAMKELRELPQIVAGTTEAAVKNASQLFSAIAPKIIVASIEEAELAKLFSNTWRYIQFAVANQFYMIASNFGSDFNVIRKLMSDGYSRADTLPSAGFAAGPCLLKDTMQLTALYNNKFFLGYMAMMVNEGLPNFIIDDLMRRHDLKTVHIGILGMAFKADIDDTRDALSYKLAKILKFHGARVSCSDEFVKNPEFVSKEEIISSCGIIIIGVPHSAYRQLEIPAGAELIDLWAVAKKSAK